MLRGHKNLINDQIVCENERQNVTALKFIVDDAYIYMDEFIYSRLSTSAVDKENSVSSITNQCLENR